MPQHVADVGGLRGRHCRGAPRTVLRPHGLLPMLLHSSFKQPWGLLGESLQNVAKRPHLMPHKV